MLQCGRFDDDGEPRTTPHSEAELQGLLKVY